MHREFDGPDTRIAARHPRLVAGGKGDAVSRRAGKPVRALPAAAG
jgi:hypothetical protein